MTSRRPSPGRARWFAELDDAEDPRGFCTNCGVNAVACRARRLRGLPACCHHCHNYGTHPRLEGLPAMPETTSPVTVNRCRWCYDMNGGPPATDLRCEKPAEHDPADPWHTYDRFAWLSVASRARLAETP